MDESTPQKKKSAPARTRTLDPLIKSQLLYRLSYRGGTKRHHLRLSEETQELVPVVSSEQKIITVGNEEKGFAEKKAEPPRNTGLKNRFE